MTPLTAPFTVFGVYEDSDAGGNWFLAQVRAIDAEQAAQVAGQEAVAGGHEGLLHVYAVIHGHHQDILHNPDGLLVPCDRPGPPVPAATQPQPNARDPVDYKGFGALVQHVRSYVPQCQIDVDLLSDEYGHRHRRHVLQLTHNNAKVTVRAAPDWHEFRIQYGQSQPVTWASAVMYTQFAGIVERLRDAPPPTVFATKERDVMDAELAAGQKMYKGLCDAVVASHPAVRFTYCNNGCAIAFTLPNVPGHVAVEARQDGMWDAMASDMSGRMGVPRPEDTTQFVCSHLRRLGNAAVRDEILDQDPVELHNVHERAIAVLTQWLHDDEDGIDVVEAHSQAQRLVQRLESYGLKITQGPNWLTATGC